MRGKKADLMNNVLTTIIAVVGLVIIFIAAWQLYSVSVNQAEMNARRTIDSIEGRFDNLEEGQVGSMTIRRMNGWAIVGWDKDGERKPDKCYFKSCICMCKYSGNERDKGNFIDVCQANGYCRLFDNSMADVFSIYNYEDITFASSQQQIFRFFSSPSDYNAEFWLDKGNKGDYKGFLTNYMAWLNQKENLVEIYLYKNKNFVGIVELISGDGSAQKSGDLQVAAG